MTTISNPAKRIPSLDGLRAVSILCVIAGHCANTQVWGPLLATFGVQVFFVISGYLITSLLQSERERNGRIDLLAFYRRRSVRIFPAAFTYIAFTALIAPASRPDLPYAITYTMSYDLRPATHLFGHLWSLSVEEQFYLLWPIALALGFRYRGRIAIVSMLFAALFRLGCIGFTSPDSLSRVLHFAFPSTMDSIAAGCLLAVYQNQIRARWQWLTRHASIAATLPVATFLIAFALWRNTFTGNTIAAPERAVLWGIIPVLIAVCIFLAVERKDWVLNNPIAWGLGGLSYSLYLWQQPLTVAPGSIALRLLLLGVFAFLSFGLIEKPILDFYRGRVKPPSPKAVCPAKDEAAAA